MKSDIKVNLSLDTVKKAVGTFLHRFHVILFVVTVLGGLAAVIFLLNNAIVASTQANGYTPDLYNNSFDQATIKKIQNLQTSGQSGPLTLPPGRNNPFVE